MSTSQEPSDSNDIRITIEHIGPVSTHNLICWVCNERKAVYHMNPTWCFSPCWECDKAIGGALHRIKSKLLRKILS